MLRNRQGKRKTCRESTKPFMIVERSAVKMEVFLVRVRLAHGVHLQLGCFEGETDSEIVRLWRASRSWQQA
ncbi:hypothetical protein D3C83_198970 [compost metagenome]